MAYFPLSKCEKGNVPCIPNKQKCSGVSKRWEKKSHAAAIVARCHHKLHQNGSGIEKGENRKGDADATSMETGLKEDVKRNKVNMITVESVSDAVGVGVLNRRLSNTRTIYRCLAFVCRLHLKHPGLFNGTLSTFICIRSFCYRFVYLCKRQTDALVRTKSLHNVAHSTSAEVLKNWVGFIQNNFRRKGLAMSCAEWNE